MTPVGIRLLSSKVGVIGILSPGLDVDPVGTISVLSINVTLVTYFLISGEMPDDATFSDMVDVGGMFFVLVMVSVGTKFLVPGGVSVDPKFMVSCVVTSEVVLNSCVPLPRMSTVFDVIPVCVMFMPSDMAPVGTADADSDVMEDLMELLVSKVIMVPVLDVVAGILVSSVVSVSIIFSVVEVGTL